MLCRATGRTRARGSRAPGARCTRWFAPRACDQSRNHSHDPFALARPQPAPAAPAPPLQGAPAPNSHWLHAAAAFPRSQCHAMPRAPSLSLSEGPRSARRSPAAHEGMESAPNTQPLGRGTPAALATAAKRSPSSRHRCAAAPLRWPTRQCRVKSTRPSLGGRTAGPAASPRVLSRDPCRHRSRNVRGDDHQHARTVLGGGPPPLFSSTRGTPRNT